MTFFLLLSALLHRSGRCAALGWTPKHPPLSLIADGAPRAGAGVEGALVGSLTQQQRAEASGTQDLSPPPSASLSFANYLSYLCSIPHL